MLVAFDFCVGIFIVPECKKSFNLEKKLCIQIYLSLTTGLVHSTEVEIGTPPFVQESCLKKTSNPVPACQSW